MLRAVTLTLLLATLTMAPHAAAQNTAVIPPMPGFIIFGAEAHLAYRDMTTGEARLLPDRSGGVHIHPDGRWVAYENVHVMDLATEQLLQISTGAARWHPTEGWLTVHRYIHDGRDLSGINRLDLPPTLNFQPSPDVTVTQGQTASGTNITTITRVYPTPDVPLTEQPYLPLTRENDLAWRNDGEQLIIERNLGSGHPSGSRHVLYRLDLAACRRADGTLDAAACEAALVPLTQGVYAFAKRPAYSPDGRWLAFDASRLPGTEENHFPWRIVVLDLHTGAMREVTTPVHYDRPAGDSSPYGIVDDLGPVWGPDGRTLLFTRSASTRDRRVGLLLHNLDTGEEFSIPPVEGLHPGGSADWWWPGKYAPATTP